MKLVMLDAPLTIKSNKTDSTGKTLAGAKMEVKDASGNVIYSYTTTEEILTLPKELFAVPKADGMACYTLSEKEAPQGYELARDISFGIDKDGKLYVKNENGGYTLVEDGILVMVDASSTTSTTTNTTITTTNHKTKIPKTGDGTPLGTLLLIFWVMIAGMVMSFIKYFRQKKRRNMRLKEKQYNGTL
ncbi:MAG: prealbumin-like fold domain-containing protein [Lachnospiraceae bacterium]|nr:prealbumin-like fold domain-containing protein [Lachnospiraceae bacterium]